MGRWGDGVGFGGVLDISHSSNHQINITHKLSITYPDYLFSGDTLRGSIELPISLTQPKNFFLLLFFIL